MDQEKIGKYISESRKNKGFTQQELAEILGVSDRTIGNWENGRNMPDYSLLQPLCNALNIGINDLFHGEEIKEKVVYDENVLKIIKKYNRMKKRDRVIMIVLATLVIILSTVLIALGIYQAFDAQYNLSSGISTLMNIEINKNSAKTKVGTLEGYEVYLDQLENAYFTTIGGKHILIEKALQQNKVSLADLKEKAWRIIYTEDAVIYRYENYEMHIKGEEIVFRPISIYGL